MPRRNQRAEHDPLAEVIEVGIPAANIAPVKTRRELVAEREERWRRQVERDTERRTNRVLKALGDWSGCCIAGCEQPSIQRYWSRDVGEKTTADLEHMLPVCLDHATVIWAYMQRVNGEPDFIEAAQDLRNHKDARAEEKHEAEKVAHLKRVDGDMYFVRLNGMVKVGWSRELTKRLKDYGASAEVLCHYPATRDDETTLHRQLRPALAKGREWYHDGDIIALFLAKALEQYGPPTAKAYWTEPKDVIRQRKRR